ncbi:MAG: 2-isopropylmalate synthase [DPANN group archaeon]|nr:2-isopropylmalate synthase [DPANN group archaeon]
MDSFKIELMDTTLRDGEQTPSVSYSSKEKLEIAQYLLCDLKLDRIEVASARVSSEEVESVRAICDFARSKNMLEKVEVLGFVDGVKSVDWISGAGCKVMNLLAKSSLNHLKGQLKKTPEGHVSDIKKTVDYAVSKGMVVNVYLEDWSSGMVNSRDYVYFLIDNLSVYSGISRIMLADTLGMLNFMQVSDFVSDLVRKYPKVHFDFHAHNDYGLAVSNTLAAIVNGVSGVHTTVNGFGERAGNTSLDEVVVSVKDVLRDSRSVDGRLYVTGIDESKLLNASLLVNTFSGKRIASNKPIVGDDVFTQTAGIHADGDKKKGLYMSLLTPDRFGRERTYALGKLSGMASVEMNLDKLGIRLSDCDKKRVYERVVELGMGKKQITSSDLPYIIADVLGTPLEIHAKISDVCISVRSGSKQKARFKLNYKGIEVDVKGIGDGGFDAFWNGVKGIAPKLKFQVPVLVDYEVRIPPGGKTDALVETTIIWELGGKRFKTLGVDSDQTLAAIEAAEKMLNLV